MQNFRFVVMSFPGEPSPPRFGLWSIPRETLVRLQGAAQPDAASFATVEDLRSAIEHDPAFDHATRQRVLALLPTDDSCAEVAVVWREGGGA